MDLYLAVGIPEGYTELLAGITFEPKLLSLSTDVVSVGGSLITAVVKGVGVNDNVTLVDSATSEDFCQSSRVVSYGVLECLTKTGELTSTVTLAVKNTDSGTEYACAASDQSECQLSTFDSSTDQMSVTSVSLQSSTEIQLSGANLNSADITGCEAIFLGLSSDSCVLSTDGLSVSVVFNNGVPTTTTDEAPELKLLTATATHFAVIDPSAVLSNPLNTVTTQNNIVSSFAGGKMLQVQANGLTSDVMLERAEIHVCEKKCITVASESSDSIYTCMTPAISTTQSNSVF